VPFCSRTRRRCSNSDIVALCFRGRSPEREPSGGHSAWLFAIFSGETLLMSFDTDLMALLLDAADGLPLVEKKRMFGFEALWGEGRIFALVWQGRISLRLPDRAAAAELLRHPGAAALTIAGGKTNPAGQRWINVPESFHDDPHELRRWVGRAYDLALLQPLPPRRKRRARRA
jgi:TfoX/Sxy family transcriptional regulator of competence genes